jgi:hypothetical protein
VVPRLLVLAHGVVAPAVGAAGVEGAAVSAVITEVLSTEKAVIVATDTVITVTNNITADTIAEKINEEHRLAHSAAETAVAHAVRCGQLLIQQRKAMNHGEFMPWVKKNCEFSHATANRYMKAGQNPHAVGISLRHLFPSGRKPNGSGAMAVPSLSARPARLSRKDLRDLRLYGELHQHCKAMEAADNAVRKAVRALRRAKKEASEQRASARAALDAFREGSA